jgi:hypothetical protein
MYVGIMTGLIMYHLYICGRVCKCTFKVKITVIRFSLKNTQQKFKIYYTVKKIANNTNCKV